MVTKAIERAQNTVEQRNAEIRKNVLKYDEVMNEQRKVIYKRRDQILDDADLRDERSVPRRGRRGRRSPLLRRTTTPRSGTSTASPPSRRLLAAPSSPSTSSTGCRRTDELYDLLMGEATGYYEQREAGARRGTMREIERQVMLQIIDQHWREHLYEMDYLAGGHQPAGHGPEGPARRVAARGLRDVRRDDDSIAQDFVKYVMHVQVVVEDQPSGPAVTDMQYSAPDDPSGRRRHGRGGGRRRPSATDGESRPPRPAEEEVINTPVVKSDWDKTPRNAPCPCGSGKKFKQCHGAA